MTALGLEVLTLAFPDPDIQDIFPRDFKTVNWMRFSQSAEQVNLVATSINSELAHVQSFAAWSVSSLSYSFAEANKIRTLSTTNTSPGHDIDGLLFVPSLPSGVCEEAAKWVPKNATRPANLPEDKAIFWVGIAPWINPNCTLAYFTAAQGTPIQAFLFYLTDGEADTPPVPNSPSWGLGDGGNWRISNKYPVYAIPSTTGQTLVQHMADYSGNVTAVPNGHILANEYAADDYVRLAVEINIGGGNSLPSLWVFLLIVLGILILIIGTTSCSMHWLQRKRRERLRRRVANGDVDLEALGIKRLTVPQEVIDKMTTYTYSGDHPESEKSAVSTEVSANSLASPAAGSSRSEADHSLAHNHASHFSQATCPICLDDYISGETLVRELPCRHIFHPECIDSFLRQNSSLCPMCKKTVLPKGYCPAVITNAMVRRERMVRRVRERVRAEPGTDSSTLEEQSRTLPRVRDAVRTAVSGGRRVFSAPVRYPGANSSSQGLEMRSATGPVSVNDISPARSTSEQPCAPSPEPTPPSNGQGRREWARQRAVAMLGSRRDIQDSEIEAEAARRPVWRRVVGKIWPGLA